MNKKIVSLILIIFISFCFISIAVADNATHHDNSTTDHGKTIDKNKTKTTDKSKASDKNKTDDKSKNYILANGHGNDIRFSDGFRGFLLDYSKSPASSGDEFKRASASSASNSNTLKLAIIECYKLGSSGNIGQIMANFIKTGSSSSKVGEAVANSNEHVGDYEVVKIDNNTEAVFNFEVLQSVSGNESDYFAYTVSFRSINEDDDVNQTNNITNTTNTTNTTNITNITQPFGNETNATFLKGLYDYLAFLANAFYDVWKPIFDTLMKDFLMIITALEGLAELYENIMLEIQSLMDALNELLKMLESIWDALDGLFKLISWIMALIQQLIDLIQAILNFILELIAAIIALIEQILALLLALINFLLDLINQILALIYAILDFLKSVGSFLINVIGNALIIIVAFVMITIGAFVYDRIR